MKRIFHILLVLLPLLPFLASCEPYEAGMQLQPSLPDGTPVTLRIGFGKTQMTDIDVVATKGEASAVDETRVHDLYVLIFDNNQTVNGSARKIYGRYFSFEHMTSTLAALDAMSNEGWWVQNKTMSGVTPVVEETTGIVKISTVSSTNATLVLLANLATTAVSFNGTDVVGYLNAIENFDELRGTQVKLNQNIVNRKDFFLMMGVLEGVNTSELTWGSLPQNYAQDSQITLGALDAKVKFLVKANPSYISDLRAVDWQVCRTPDRCYLFSDYAGGSAPDDVVYFDAEPAYFEGQQVVDGQTWDVFTFYMLESRFQARRTAQSYHDRERRYKTDTGESGYQGAVDTLLGTNFVKNGDWIYAQENAAYVKFNAVLTLTQQGIYAINGNEGGSAITSDVDFTVHLGNFGSSGLGPYSEGFNDYNTLRNHAYTYKITINNSKSIYTEVVDDKENQPGQEGFLLMTSEKIVNADAHYEYHSLNFGYNPNMTPEKFSWFVKTPFGQGGPKKIQNPTTGAYEYDGSGLDYKWVKFSVNQKKDDGSSYSDNHAPYPGDSQYQPAWKPSSGDPHPVLMDINQLVMYMFDQTDKKSNGRDNDFVNDTIKITIFIDEYYYTVNPLLPEDQQVADPNLWRRFVNAKPREMHILSDARPSRDRRSDIVYSSHSVVQQSIQSIYNIYAPGLQSLWGCEHLDEIKQKEPAGWPYWPKQLGNGSGTDGRVGGNTELGRENGRLNSAFIWEFYSRQDISGSDQTGKEWDTYLDFEVDNNTPALREKYHGMAWSCLSRNRDNNGDGKVDRDEIRWYMAASRQLQGIWVGRESLSPSARLYQPAPGEWRAHVLSSTNKQSCWAEEGGAFGNYDRDYNGESSAENTWNSVDEAAHGESVRCLRNVGTYLDNGELKDITFAPYAQEVDKYYTLEDHGTVTGEGPYTIYFDRLNPMSIRPYSEGELPYHDQNSILNQVYVKFSTQSRAQDVNYSKVKFETLNPDITARGYNPYCPPGYRLPNHTEAIMMTLILDWRYFRQDTDGKDIQASYPTRTYYDRGFYGSLRSGTAPWAKEWQKVGWAIGSHDQTAHCMEYHKEASHSRCVRDDDMTGDITGTLSVDENVLFPGDWTDVSFNIQSTASALTAASLKLCYHTHEGYYRELDLPVETPPAGLQYRATQRIALPNVDDLGLAFSDLPLGVTLQAQVHNLSGLSQTIELPVTLRRPLRVAPVTFPTSGYDPEKGWPVHLNFAADGHTVKLQWAQLSWKEADGGWNVVDLPLDTDFERSVNRNLYLKDIIGQDAFSDLANGRKRYDFKLTVTSDDGFTLSSPVTSMEILRYGYVPNPTPAGGWTNINQCQTTWDDAVDNIDFAKGDFVEVEMDLSECRYAYIDGNGDHDIGKDNIIAFSTNALNNNPGHTILWYYPMVQNLVPDPSGLGRIWMTIHARSWTSKKEIDGVVDRMNLILGQEGLLLDGERLNWNHNDLTLVLTELAGASTIHVGSVEGKHHSRAKYDYVRVIRFHE